MKTVFAGTLAVLLLLFGAFQWLSWNASQQFDIIVSAPNAPLDQLKYGLVPLAKSARENPKANRFRVDWAVLPDAKRPLEALPRTLEYNRKTAVLEWAREGGALSRFEGVTPAILQKVAARGGGVVELGEAGAKVSNVRQGLN